MDTCYEDFISVLECPVCYGRMSSPIWICQNGHNVCSMCRPSLQICPICKANFTICRNIALEQIAEMVPWECCNKRYGCNVKTLLNKLLEHEKQCPLKGIACQLTTGCTWRGTIDELIDHWTLTEDNKLYITSQTLRLTDFRKKNSNFINLMMHCNTLFWLKVRQMNNSVYWVVQIINQELNPKDFYFEIEILNSDMRRRKVVLSEYCSVLKEGFNDDVFVWPKSVCVPNYNLDRYLDSDGNLLFNIKVSFDVNTVEKVDNEKKSEEKDQQVQSNASPNPANEKSKKTKKNKKK